MKQILATAFGAFIGVMAILYMNVEGYLDAYQGADIFLFSLFLAGGAIILSAISYFRKHIS